MFKIALLVLIFLAPVLLRAQDTSTYVLRENFKREIIIEGKRYRVYNNWVTFGGGAGYHSANPRTQVVLSMNFQYHIRKYYFNFGGLVSGDEFGVWNNYSVHMGFVPFRKENEQRNMAAMLCMNYTVGYDYLFAGHYSSQRWDRVGLYAEFQYTMKVQYAVGIGPTFFVDWNPKRTLVGLRLEGYLSGAYRGYARGYGPPVK